MTIDPNRTNDARLHPLLRRALIKLGFRLFRGVLRPALLRVLDPGGAVTMYQNRAATEQTSGSILPVVMCTWRRIERLASTVELLRHQRGVQPALFLWNNNRMRRKDVNRVVFASKDLPITAYHSRFNIGGFGRFYVARHLARRSPFVIFIDDDQQFDELQMSRFANEFEPRTIKSRWAFRFTQPWDYARRIKIPGGAVAHYCGTGGMVSDAAIFLDSRLFQCPRRYWFIEDLWLCYFATQICGWTLRKIDAPSFFTVNDGEDQFWTLRNDKQTFFQYLLTNRDWALREEE